VVTCCCGAATAIAVARLDTGTRITAKSALRDALRRLRPLVKITILLVLLVVLLGSFLVTLPITLLAFVGGIGAISGPFVGIALLLATDASFTFVNAVAFAVYAVTLPYVALVLTYMCGDLRHRTDAAAAESAASHFC
jgi:uncharacterized membrane protein